MWSHLPLHFPVPPRRSPGLAKAAFWALSFFACSAAVAQGYSSPARMPVQPIPGSALPQSMSMPSPLGNSDPGDSLRSPASTSPPSTGSNLDTIYRCANNFFTQGLGAKDIQALKCVAVARASVAPKNTSDRTGFTPRASVANRAESLSQSASAPGDQGAASDMSRQDMQLQLANMQARLGQLTAAYNGGEPERMGNERNFATYQTRVESMKREMDDLATLIAKARLALGY